MSETLICNKLAALTGAAACSIKNAGKEVLHQRLCSLHPNIVKFHKVFLTDTHFCIVNEYAPGGDLVDLIEANDALSEDKSRWLFQQVVVAVDYCHQVCSLVILLDCRHTICAACNIAAKPHQHCKPEPDLYERSSS